MTPWMDQVRKLLKDLMGEAGIKEAPLSEKVGKNPAYFNQFFGTPGRKPSPKNLPEDVRDQLAAIFRVSPDSFKTGKRIAARPPGDVILRPSAKPLGRVVESGAALARGNATVLVLRLDEGQELTIEVDAQGIEALKENLAALEPYARQTS